MLGGGLLEGLVLFVGLVLGVEGGDAGGDDAAGRGVHGLVL
jgi:hypothetical protein